MFECDRGWDLVVLTMSGACLGIEEERREGSFDSFSVYYSGTMKILFLVSGKEIHHHRTASSGQLTPPTLRTAVGHSATSSSEDNFASLYFQRPLALLSVVVIIRTAIATIFIVASLAVAPTPADYATAQAAPALCQVLRLHSRDKGTTELIAASSLKPPEPWLTLEMHG